jgi:hypothetical protein
MMKVTYHLEHPNLQIFLSNSPTHLHWYWGCCGLCVDLLGVDHLFTTTYIRPCHLFKSIYHMILLYKLIVNYLSKIFEGCVFKWPKSIFLGNVFLIHLKKLLYIIAYKRHDSTIVSSSMIHKWKILFHTLKCVRFEWWNFARFFSLMILWCHIYSFGCHCHFPIPTYFQIMRN